MRSPSECSHVAGQGWKAAGASAVGKSHLTDATPCQDAHWIVTLPSGVVIAVVADGAGSVESSEIGARRAVRAVADAVAAALDGGSPPLGEEVCSVLRRSFQAARAALDEEAAVRNMSVGQLATTLLVALIHREGAAFAAVGDCVAVYRDSAGEWMMAMAPERGEYANETTFLTSAEWEGQLQMRILQTAPDRVALFSDGLQRLALNLSVPAPHRPFFESVFDFAAQKANLAQAAEALGQFLASERVDARTDDDKTLVLLWAG